MVCKPHLVCFLTAQGTPGPVPTLTPSHPIRRLKRARITVFPMVMSRIFSHAPDLHLNIPYTIYSINYFLEISSGALGQLGHDISLGLLLD